MDPNALHNPALTGVVLLLVIVMVAVGIIPYWKIFSKAGFSGWLALLMLVPLANLILLYVVAFSDWKVQPYQQPMAPPPVLPGQHPW